MMPPAVAYPPQHTTAAGLLSNITSGGGADGKRNSAPPIVAPKASLPPSNSATVDGREATGGYIPSPRVSGGGGEEILNPFGAGTATNGSATSFHTLSHGFADIENPWKHVEITSDVPVVTTPRTTSDYTSGLPSTTVQMTLEENVLSQSEGLVGLGLTESTVRQGGRENNDVVFEPRSIEEILSSENENHQILQQAINNDECHIT